MDLDKNGDVGLVGDVDDLYEVLRRGDINWAIGRAMNREWLERGAHNLLKHELKNESTPRTLWDRTIE